MDRPQAEQDEPVREEPKQAVAQFPFMLRHDPQAERLTKAAASTTPSIDLAAHYHRYHLVDWLSSCTAAPPILEPPSHYAEEADEPPLAVNTSDFLSGEVQATHLTPAEWAAACAFFRFDPAEIDPRSCVYYDGWNKDRALKAHQFFATAWVIKQLAMGKDLAIVALATGLGKTAIGLAVLDIMRQLQGRYRTAKIPFGPPKAQAAFVNPKETDEDSAQADSGDQSEVFNLTHLAGGQVVMHQGVSLVICPLSMLAQWIEERRNFITSAQPKIVVAHETKAFTKGEREGKYVGCYHVTDKVREEDWPPISDLLAAGFQQQDLDAYRDSGGMPMQTFLEPSTKRTAESWHGDWVVFTTPVSVGHWIETTDRPKTATQKQQIDAVWCLVLFDEFHAVKAISTAPFPTIGALAGNPPIVALSATLYTKKSRDVAGISIASHAKYFDLANKGRKTVF